MAFEAEKKLILRNLNCCAPGQLSPPALSPLIGKALNMLIAIILIKVVKLLKTAEIAMKIKKNSGWLEVEVSDSY
jgi:hypothetical protein